MEQPTNTRYCQNCGEGNRAVAKFCIKCGASLPPPDMPEQVAIPDPGSTPVIESPAQELAPVQPDEPATVQVTPVEAVAPSAVDEPAQSPAPVAVSEPLQPLAVGTEIYTRYKIIEALETGGATNRYRVSDAQRCSVCNTENINDEEYCPGCGAEKNATPGLCLFVECRAPSNLNDVPEKGFIFENRLYVVESDKPQPATKKTFTKGVYLAYGAKSDRGLARADALDQDSVFAAAFTTIYDSIAQPTIGLFIVADGVGGGDLGELASMTGVQNIVAQLLTTIIAPALLGQDLAHEVVRDALRSAILFGNEKVLAVATEKEADLGTTVTLALILDDRLYVANVGDSRTYLLNGARIEQITIDHSLVQSFVDKGEVQKEDVYTHPQRNFILRSLGANTKLDVDIFPAEGGAITLQPNARLLLCCDGVWEMVRTEGVERALLAHPFEPQKICEQLVADSNANGGDDNISVVVVSVGE